MVWKKRTHRADITGRVRKRIHVACPSCDHLETISKPQKVESAPLSPNMRNLLLASLRCQGRIQVASSEASNSMLMAQHKCVTTWTEDADSQRAMPLFLAFSPQRGGGCFLSPQRMLLWASDAVGCTTTKIVHYTDAADASAYPRHATLSIWLATV